MLNYMENIIGTARYIKPLFKIHNILEQLLGDILQKDMCCKSVEREMKHLEAMCKEVVSNVGNVNKNIRMKNLHIQKCLSEKRSQLSKYFLKQKFYEDQIKFYDNEIRQLQLECKEKEQAFEEEKEYVNELYSFE